MMNEKQYSQKVAGLTKSAKSIRENGQILAVEAVAWVKECPQNAPARAHALLKGLQGQARLFAPMRAYIVACGFRVAVDDGKIRVSVPKDGVVTVPAHGWMDNAPKKAGEPTPFSLEKFLQGGAKRGGIEVAVLQAYIRSASFKNEVDKLRAVKTAVDALQTTK